MIKNLNDKNQTEGFWKTIENFLIFENCKIFTIERKKNQNTKLVFKNVVTSQRVL